MVERPVQGSDAARTLGETLIYMGLQDTGGGIYGRGPNPYGMPKPVNHPHFCASFAYEVANYCWPV